MAIFLTKDTRFIIQGITGRIGAMQAEQALLYGSKLVGGTSVGKGGQVVCGLPVFNTVREAMDATGANASVIFVPARFAPDAAFEALDAGIRLIVIITEHIPVSDTMRIRERARTLGATIIGPNCSGLLTPGVGKMGIIPGFTASVGHTGIISRSGTLSFEAAADLTQAGIGQSTIVGIGGDQVPCTSMTEAIAAFEEDPETDSIVLIGEVGGDAEERAAEYISAHVHKPVAAYIAGRSAPSGKKMGHAGAIIRGKAGTAAAKNEALARAGVHVANTVGEIPTLVSAALRR